ncbi:hypothetical protein N1851_023106 [Merluccius polli]|uniref:Uncharacterized protein n=1 Tax=Merluccius polli TaxID=89951 RepID=A0AA47MH75_MERPO|nr:hypothetical protein N1851_023106 [Merluccius polli]
MEFPVLGLQLHPQTNDLLLLPLIDPPGPLSADQPYNFPDFPLPAQPFKLLSCAYVALERETRQQDTNKTWHLARAPRLTSSVFKAICSRRADFDALAVRFKDTSSKQTKAMRRGIELEACGSAAVFSHNSESHAPHLGTSSDRRSDGSYRLKEIHAYYYQIIGQLGLTGMPWCDFFVMCAERLPFAADTF